MTDKKCSHIFILVEHERYSISTSDYIRTTVYCQKCGKINTEIKDARECD